MQSLVIEASNYTPLIDFQQNGYLLIEGRCVPENADKIFDPLVNFVSELTTSEVVIDINLEYFNTCTAKRLFQLLYRTEKNWKIEQFHVNWHYEKGDNDSVEVAEVLEECLDRATFHYTKHDGKIELAHSRPIVYYY
jgi:hypothetical protein